MTLFSAIDHLGWGFILLGSGLVTLILELRADPPRGVDAFMRSFVIMCLAIGMFIITNETLLHIGLLDESAEPSLLAMSRSMG